MFGEPGDRLRRRLADHAADDAGDVRVDAREGADHGQRRSGRAQADADAAELLEIDRAAAQDQRAVGEVDVAQHASLIGRGRGQRIDQAEHVGLGSGGGGAESQHGDGRRGDPALTSKRTDSSGGVRRGLRLRVRHAPAAVTADRRAHASGARHTTSARKRFPEGGISDPTLYRGRVQWRIRSNPEVWSHEPVVAVIVV